MSHNYYLFSLPDSLLEGLVLRTFQFLPEDVSQETEETNSKDDPQHPPSSNRRCNVCPSSAFQSVEEQREHFRSDWHRYNVKLKLSKANPVSEAAFAVLLDGIIVSQYICFQISNLVVRKRWKNRYQALLPLTTNPRPPTQILMQSRASSSVERFPKTLPATKGTRQLSYVFPGQPCLGFTLRRRHRLGYILQFSHPKALAIMCPS